MQLDLIEADVHNREEQLKRCKAKLRYLGNLHVSFDLLEAHKEAMKLLEQEEFYLQDQLYHLKSLVAILKEEQDYSRDEMLPKV